jgi:hypothetical protein
MRVTFVDEDGDAYFMQVTNEEYLLRALQKSRSIAFRHNWYKVGCIERSECANEKGEMEQKIVVRLIDKVAMLR